MNILDGVMVVLFILFMVFVFGGYHKNKSAAREANSKKLDELGKDTESDDSEDLNQNLSKNIK